MNMLICWLAGLVAWLRLSVASTTHRVTTPAATVLLPLQVDLPDLDQVDPWGRTRTRVLVVDLDVPSDLPPDLSCWLCGDLTCEATTHLHPTASTGLQCLRCLGRDCPGDCADRARLHLLEADLARLGYPAPTCDRCGEPQAPGEPDCDSVACAAAWERENCGWGWDAMHNINRDLGEPILVLSLDEEE